MRTTLYGVAAMDFFVIVVVGVVLLSTALFASYLAGATGSNDRPCAGAAYGVRAKDLSLVSAFPIVRSHHVFVH